MISALQMRGNVTDRLLKLRLQLLDVAAIIELEMDFSEENISLSDSNSLSNLLNNTISFCKELVDSYRTSHILREGFAVGIIGKPNAGKSTLFNSLLNIQRSIVSEISGTTRDYITEFLYFDDIPVKLIDTAGLRETTDPIETQGIELTNQIINDSNLILLINDISNNENSCELINYLKNNYSDKPVLLIQNKIDLLTEEVTKQEEIFYISANIPDSLLPLKKKISTIIAEQLSNNIEFLINERQFLVLSETLVSLNNAKRLLDSNSISEIIAIEIRNASRSLGELTGLTWSEDVLNNIFSKFCIGK
jgi:tRNA modification GTPase